MKVVLVNMPWHWLQMPSISIGILRECAGQANVDVNVRDYYANLAWSDFILKESSGRLSPREYLEIADAGMFHGAGDWIFASALYGDEGWRAAEFDDYIEANQLGPLGELAHAMRPFAQPFVAQASQEILRMSPDVVGFTSSFSQTIAALAVAKEIKRWEPSTVTVFGGASCEGPMGSALHRGFEQVDFVVRGEGERSFPLLLECLDSDGGFERIGGLCWRDRSGAGHENTIVSAPLGMDAVPAADYKQWAAAFENSDAARYVEPRLLLETSRGCWWGEKQHCTFCGLNGELMKYRAKSGERIQQEIEHMVREFQVLDIMTVDNIMDMRSLADLLPRLAKLNWDLRIHYEVKANLRGEHLRTLRDAGVVHIQPGIENLSTKVLELMRKGVHATQNVMLLRDAEDHGITTSWNYLYGFPGEEDGDYQEVLAQVKNLHHLQPPREAGRIIIERFSPYFNDPSLGFTPSAPAAYYHFIFDLPGELMWDIAYAFEADRRGINGEVEQSLHDAVTEWRQSYHDSQLYAMQDNGCLVVRDRRRGHDAVDHTFDDPRVIEIYEALSKPRSPASVVREFSTPSKALSPTEIGDLLDYFAVSGLVFAEGGRLVSLATKGTPKHARRFVYGTS